MIVAILGVLLSVCTFSMFNTSYRISGLNKTILNAPRQIFEVAVNYVNESEYVNFSYDKKKLKEEYEAYLNKIVYKYTKNYAVTYYFYNITNKQACYFVACNGVEITFNSDINLFTHYQKVMNYEIRGVNHE